jgi:uncharacterized protein involved in exopolysaccharide biosynthesis
MEANMQACDEADNGTPRIPRVTLDAPQSMHVVMTARMFDTLWAGRWWIATFVLLGIAVGFWMVASSKHVYRVQAVLTPVSSRENGSLDLLSGGMGGLAALAGIGTPGGSRAQIALATLEGTSFTAKFIQDNNITPLLFPGKWDPSANRWRGPPPSQYEAVRRFSRGGIRTVLRDQDTGLITVEINWSDRLQAVKWLVSMVAQVNAELRSQAIAESQQNIQFLTAEAQQARVASVKAAIENLIETQMKQLMLAEAQQEYALQFVDRPTTPGPKDYVWPRPVMILCAAAFMGGLLGILVQFGLDHARRVRKYRELRMLDHTEI